MLTKINGEMLSEAFPAKYLPTTMVAGMSVAGRLYPRQWIERFSVQVDFQTVFIPMRLHISPDWLVSTETAEVRCFVNALETRSNDGFERQRAARKLLENLRPWGAPFILALIGEYVVEILQDISNIMTHEGEQELSSFIRNNELFWNTIKQRVMSYWNVYYRSNSRDGYVGFELVNRLEAVAFGRAEATFK